MKSSNYTFRGEIALAAGVNSERDSAQLLFVLCRNRISVAEVGVGIS